MTLLILGLLLWTAAHLFKRMAPDQRAALGDKGRGLVALTILGSVVLMVIGYKMAEYSPLWAAPAGAKHAVSLAVLIAFYFASPGPKKGALFHKMRHPMLTGFIIWAAAHLFVNGDVASLILFGGLGLWAIAEIIIINRAEPEWTPNPKGSIAKDGMFLGASVILVGVIGFIHGLVGPSPFS